MACKTDQQEIKLATADISRLHTVVLMGAESTGKTTLAAALAKHYKTAWAAEYLRLFVDNKGALPEESDVYAIAQGHLKLVAQVRPRARRVLFVDTDLFTTCVYQRIYFGSCPSDIEGPPCAIDQDYICSQNRIFHGNQIPANVRAQKNVYVRMHSCALRRKSMP